MDQSLRPLDEQLKTVCELLAQLGLGLLPPSSPHSQVLGPQREEGAQSSLREETPDPGAVGSGPGRPGDKEDNPILQASCLSWPETEGQFKDLCLHQIPEASVGNPHFVSELSAHSTPYLGCGPTFPSANDQWAGLGPRMPHTPSLCHL